MAVESIPIYGLLRSLLRRLPPFIVRRYYPAERLAKLIYLDFQPRCESAWVNLAEAASVRLTLQLINLSPFPVELDRAQFRFVYAGGAINIQSLDRVKIGPGETTNLYLEEPIPDGHANRMARNWQGNQAWLEGNVEFNCRVRPFAKRLGSLTGIQLTLVNANHRSKLA